MDIVELLVMKLVRKHLATMFRKRIRRHDLTLRHSDWRRYAWTAPHDCYAFRNSVSSAAVFFNASPKTTIGPSVID
jgi:hypothetical protein